MSLIKDILSQIKLSRRDNVTAIVLCLFAGTIFWFFNALNKEYSTNINYPVEYLYDEDTYQAVTAPPNEILLNMSGVGWNLLRKSIGIKVEPIEIRLESPDEVKKIAGNSLTSMVTDQVDDLSLNYILTDTLLFNFDQRVNKTFPLIIDSTSIYLDDNHFLISPVKLSIDSVTLFGPQKFMDSLGNVIVIQVPEQEIDYDYNEEIAITFPRQELFTRNPPTVNIQFDVEEFTERSLEIPVVPINFPETAFPEDSLYTFRFLAPEGFADTMSIEDFRAEIDFFEMIQEDSTAVPALVKYPETFVKLLPDSIKINILFDE